MAVVTSPYLPETAHLEEKQSLNMSSLANEQLTASNGINGGHSHARPESPKPPSAIHGLSRGGESTDELDADVINIKKNADAVAANSLAVEQNTASPSVTKLTTPDVSSDVAGAIEDKAAAPESSAPAPAVTETVAGDTTEEAGEQSETKPTKEAAGPAAASSPAKAEDQAGENGTAKSTATPSPADEDDAQSDRQGSLPSPVQTSALPDVIATPDEIGDKPGKPDSADNAAPESPEVMADAEPQAEVADEPSQEEKDVEMAEGSPLNPQTSQVSTPGVPEKTNRDDPSSVVAALPQSKSSSLLPSLRDNGTDDHSFISVATDTVMADAPLTKVARGREEDEEEERSAKRAKTEETDLSPAVAGDNAPAETGDSVTVETAFVQTPVTMPPRVRAVEKEGSLADSKLDPFPISAYANREIRRVLASVKKTKAGNNFKDPVHKKWPMLWDSYIQRVEKPVDIGMLERNLRDNIYTSHAEFVSDMFLVYENSVSFNGLTNTVTDEAKSLVDNFFTRLSEIAAQEPQKSDKKEPKQLPTRQTEPRAAASRRESRGVAAPAIEESVIAASPSPIITSVTARAPVASSPAPITTPVETATPVFAVPSSGVPIIRRDSAKNDGDRPKRPIHPPKNRDLGYEPKNPKKKQPEFRFCEETLKELMKAKHYEINRWFLKPVDPVAMQIPTYHKVIKKPMDLSTMQTKLNLGEYTSAKEFESDFNLIVKNCRKFNVVGDVVDAANGLDELFKHKWAEKDSWLAAHTAAPVLSPVAASKEEDFEEGDESDADGDEVSSMPLTSDTVDALVKRLEEENVRLNTLLMAKLPDMTMITTQQTVLNMIQKQIVEEKTKLATAESEKRARKPAKTKGAKGRKSSTGGGATKRGAGGAAGGGAPRKSAAAGTKKAPKARVLGQAEKNVVTDGINNLDGPQLEKAIEIIKKDTNQEESETGELELDIDQLSQDALGKLYDLIIKAFPEQRVKVEKPKASATDAALAKPSRPKKHKPMGKLEQERNIEKLREIKAQFQRPGSGSQEPLPSVEVGQPGRDDESEEESEADSEEE